MDYEDFKLIYDEVDSKGYYCSGSRVFMRNLDFKKECKKYNLRIIKTRLCGRYFENENVDMYILFDASKIDDSKADKILCQLYG